MVFIKHHNGTMVPRLITGVASPLVSYDMIKLSIKLSIQWVCKRTLPPPTVINMYLNIRREKKNTTASRLTNNYVQPSFTNGYSRRQHCKAAHLWPVHAGLTSNSDFDPSTAAPLGRSFLGPRLQGHPKRNRGTGALMSHQPILFRCVRVCVCVYVCVSAVGTYICVRQKYPACDVPILCVLKRMLICAVI